MSNSSEPGNRAQLFSVHTLDMAENPLTRREALAMGATGFALLAAPAPAAAHRRRLSGRTSVLPDARAVDARGIAAADLSLLEAASLLRARRLSSIELTKACLERAEQRATELNAWIRIYRETALQQAAAADARLSARRVRRLGRPPLVCGIGLGLKDIFAADGHLLTAGSKILAGNIARQDAVSYANLRRDGMVLLGHTQPHEFACGNFTPQSANPWDPTRTPGGSSGGSAIALALRTMPAATGSDTLGSLRIPAGLCGVSAIKPTRGLVSLNGIIPLASSFDHAGPMARSAADASLMLSHMVGRGRYLSAPRCGTRPLTGLRVGVPNGSFGGVPVDPGIAARVDSYLRELVTLGATLVSFTAPRSPADNLSSSEGFDFFLTVPGHEIDAYHRQWFPQRAADYTPDVRFTLTLLRAANTVPPDPARGRAVIAQLEQDWSSAFTEQRLDLVVQPAAVIPAPAKDQAMLKTQSIGDPMVVWDYLGWPVVCVPAGTGGGPLPVGVQIVGRPGRESLLCDTAITAQAHFPHHDERPPPARTA